MTTLKNTDREEVIRRVLTESFEHRFSEIRKRLREILLDKLTKEHSEFVNLFKNSETRRYLATSGAGNTYFIDEDKKLYIAASPIYGKRTTMPEHGRWSGVDRDVQNAIKIDDVVVPCTMGDFQVSDKKLIKAYRQVWNDYVSARDKLGSLLYSYNVREKFTIDFPEFAKHLPVVVTKIKLPAVVVKDVRAELAKFGVPQK